MVRAENSYMPKQVELGEMLRTTLGQVLMQKRDYDAALNGESSFKLVPNSRYIMGFRLPDWQRDLCWNQDQMISFMQSLWRGIPVGTYTYNENLDDPKLDFLLIDGQQRMFAISEYLSDEFPVYGFYYSDLPAVDKRRFSLLHFPCYLTKSSDETYLREYYNLMNFGGVAHKRGQEA